MITVYDPGSVNGDLHERATIILKCYTTHSGLCSALLLNTELQNTPILCQVKTELLNTCIYYAYTS